MLKLYDTNDANSPRLATDSLFFDYRTKYALSGQTDRLIRFVESVQLKDVALWKRVIRQFRSTPDDFDNGWRCEFFGKLMRGGCAVWSYTRDEELYRILTDAIKEMLTTQDELGRFSTYSVEAEFNGWDMWGRKYVLLGFQYYLEICQDDALAARLVTSMQAHADYILSKIGNTDGKKNITLTSHIWQGLNSSTILEPLVRLYNITKEPRYLEFARYIVENGGIEGGDLVELALEGALQPHQYPVTKAYEMMSFFEGVLEFYRVTHEEKYRKAVENFASAVLTHEISIIGSAGCTHELFDNTVTQQTNGSNMIVVQETCVTVTWMKVCFQLLCLTGDAKYADCIECSAYNALFGSVNTERSTNNNGFPFDSYSPLLPNKRGRKTGGYKVFSDGNAYGCCAAIGACGMGLVPKATCLTRRDGITLSLYCDGTVDTYLPSGTPLHITITGGYPIGANVRIQLRLSGDEEFVFALRIPQWSTQTTLHVNGAPQALKNGMYAEISRCWKDGDCIDLCLDLRTKQKLQDNFASFTRGPLVLARDARLEHDIFAEIDVLLNEDGSVKTAPSDSATFPVELEQKLLLTCDREITLIDYASAGKTWDYDSIMTAWIPVGEAW